MRVTAIRAKYFGRFVPSRCPYPQLHFPLQFPCISYRYSISISLYSRFLRFWLSFTYKIYRFVFVLFLVVLCQLQTRPIPPAPRRAIHTFISLHMQSYKVSFEARCDILLLLDAHSVRISFLSSTQCPM